MKLKSFKTILKEEKNKDLLNAFIEDTFKGLWNKIGNNFGNFTTDYACKGGETLYRIIFFTKEEINQLDRVTDLKIKIKGLFTQENQSHPRFYTKDDYHNIPNHLSYLSSIGEKIHGYTDEGAEQNYMGVIISRSSGKNDNIDFSNYDGKNGNDEIKTRIAKTLPVLAINDMNFKILANLEFVDRKGWTINKIKPHELNMTPDEPENELEINPDEGEVK